MAPTLDMRYADLGNLREIRFTFQLAGETVPGLVYLPQDIEEPVPFVLIQHPGMGSKDDYFVADTARMWAPFGWACGGLDAPLHGDRDVHDPMALFRDRDRFPEITAAFAREVSTAIDLLAGHFPIDTSRLGFTGFSLGSMLGIPAVALDGRFRAAAFCLVGEGGMVGAAEGPGSVVPGLANVAVRIVAKEHDELIPRPATEALYEALPGKKDIRWLPGGHFEIGPDVIRAAREWLVAEL
jgi:predicted esterase